MKKNKTVKHKRKLTPNAVLNEVGGAVDYKEPIYTLKQKIKEMKNEIGITKELIKNTDDTHHFLKDKILDYRIGIEIYERAIEKLKS